MPELRSGGCNCGAVRLEAYGEPKRVGLCHCTTCRKETGSVFMSFAVWEARDVKITGATQSWTQDSGQRHFCAKCGSHLFGTNGAEIEVRLGCLDEAPSDLTPEYEAWVKRREPWLEPVAEGQFRENRV